MPCIYNLQRPGARSRYNSSAAARRRQCLFCDSAWLEKACSNAKGRSNVLSNLKKFRAVYEDKPHVYNSALLRLPDACRDELHRAAVRRERRAQPKAQRVPAPARRSTRSKSRPIGSGSRRSSSRPTTPRRRRWRTLRTTTQGCRRPFFSEQGRFVELWAKFGSWGICNGCRSLQPRRLEPIDCRRVAKPDIAPRACKACQNGKAPIPKFGDIPRFAVSPKKLSWRFDPWTSTWAHTGARPTATGFTAP